MNRYERTFGAGPRGLIISLGLFILTWRLESVAGLPGITASAYVRQAVFGISIVVSAALALWSFKSLPAAARGEVLVTTGPYRYLRHPLYACLLSSFNFGLAVLLNNWIYLLWALSLHGLWHWTIRREEKLMTQAFPDTYPAYCRATGRFFPRAGFKTGFEATRQSPEATHGKNSLRKSSEKLVVKARGEKGSEAC